MTNVLFLNPSISRMARAAVNFLLVCIPQGAHSLCQIFESGTASTSVTYNASAKESVWQSFVATTPGCSSTVGTQATLDCLQSVNSSAIYQGLLEAIAQSTLTEATLSIPVSTVPQVCYPIYPPVSGPKDVSRNFPLFRVRTWTKVQYPKAYHLSVPFDSRSQERCLLCLSWISLSLGLGVTSRPTFHLLLSLKGSWINSCNSTPDDPVLGSPYGTGNQTFGLPSGYKRLTSMCQCNYSLLLLSTIYVLCRR